MYGWSFRAFIRYIAIAVLVVISGYLGFDNHRKSEEIKMITRQFEKYSALLGLDVWFYVSWGSVL